MTPCKRIYPVAQRVAAGLINEHTVEFFASGYSRKAIHCGKVVDVNELPEEILEVILNDIKKDSKASKALDEMGLISEESRIEQFLLCRFGGFDNTPDMVDGVLGAGEYWPCPNRGNCPHEFRLCSPVIGTTGDALSGREVEILQLLAADNSDKMIAANLNISEKTVEAHLAKIRAKTGASTSKGLVRFAIEKNLI
jgi:DNA-binding CsgD family transcriptional regulator